jgi:hypothetical protein
MRDFEFLSICQTEYREKPMIEVHCTFRAGIGRGACDDYVRAVRFDVVADDELGNQFVIGKMNADQLLVFDAVHDGLRLLDVCDTDSQGLCETFEALFTPEGELQTELAIVDTTHHLLFLWRAMFHPVLEPYLPAILETVVSLAGMNTLIAMWHRVACLPEDELARLGFQKIAGSDLIFRHSANVSQFSMENPEGIEVPPDFAAKQEYEQWVLEKWQREGNG